MNKEVAIKALLKFVSQVCTDPIHDQSSFISRDASKELKYGDLQWYIEKNGYGWTIRELIRIANGYCYKCGTWLERKETSDE
jgi:hypothetical protein